MALQCLITTYRRPKYLEQCLRSMRDQAGAAIELFVVSGDDDPETVAILEQLADRYRLIPDNPGADVLKNEGIADFITDPSFLISSDDFLYPANWVPTVLEQWERCNQPNRAFAMMASPSEEIVAFHAAPGFTGGTRYRPIRGLDLMPTGVSMCAGAMMDSELCDHVRRALKRKGQAGPFPVYGVTGQGDIAIAKEFAALGFEVGYFRHPVLKHIGGQKGVDYPEYTADFAADDSVWQARARKHRPASTRYQAARA
jgi:glycosyltransferase involved in cell wall biosynthesis